MLEHMLELGYWQCAQNNCTNVAKYVQMPALASNLTLKAIYLFLIPYYTLDIPQITATKK